MLADNRKATFDYAIERRIEAGIALLGTEIKSIRAGRANLAEGYARVERGQVWLRAAVTASNAYRLTQTPLTFIVTVKRGEWQWPILDIVAYRDHAFTARLGEVVITTRSPT